MLLQVFLFVFHVVSGFRPLVQTRYGDIEGTVMRSFLNRDIYAYLSIPYAKPPIGERRFEDAEAFDGTWDTFDASSDPPSCPQILSNAVVAGQEDCLVINVYSPVYEADGDYPVLLPVLVYIHGGAFYFANGNIFGPRYMLDQDVLYVNFNYRLGVLGFLSTEDDALPGNYGLKDQVLALEWVQNNIHYFGGNASRVTLIGMSAGSTSVHYHYFSPLSRGLFHGGFMIGGSGMVTWSFQTQPREKALMIGSALNCSTETTQQLADCLRQKDVDTVVSSIRLFINFPHLPISPIGPVMDNLRPRPFFMERPIDSLTHGRFYNAPTVFSDVYQEGLYPIGMIFSNSSYMNVLNEFWADLGSSIFDIRPYVSKQSLRTVMEYVRQEYFGDQPISVDTRGNLVKMLSDWFFLYGNSIGITLHANQKDNTYFYIFNYRGRLSSSIAITLTQTDFGASHIDDLMYYLNFDNAIELNQTDVMMMYRLSTMLGNFVKTGVPEMGGFNWRPVERGSSAVGPIRAMRINSPTDLEMIEEVNFGNGRFWEHLITSAWQRLP